MSGDEKTEIYREKPTMITIIFTLPMKGHLNMKQIEQEGPTAIKHKQFGKNRFIHP